jgi:hypothetical protein
MATIGKRLSVQDNARTERRRRSTYVVLVTAFGLSAPQWAYAQVMTEEGMTEEGMTADEAMTEEGMTADEAMTADDAALEEQRLAGERITPAPMPGDRSDGAGAAVAAGGGVSDFSHDSARDFVDTGGAWELRGVFGTRSLVGVEAAYIGSAYEIASPGESTTLLGNGVEVSGRVNLLRNGMDNRRAGLQPYVLAGFAWKNYQLSGDLATAAVDDEDNAFEIPVGTGVAYYFENGIMLDGRFAYRFAFEDELIQPVGDAEDANLDNWSATARLGLEF